MLKSIVILILSTGYLPAAQIFFSSDLLRTNLTSDDRPLDPEWVFALGAFEEGFVPTRNNRSEWASKWTTAKSTSFQTNFDWFSSGYRYLANTPPFTSTNQGYLWGYDCTGEWILVTSSSWTWPVPVTPFDVPKSWTMDNAETAIVGAVNLGEVHMRTEGGGEGFEIPPVTYEDWREGFFTEDERSDLSISGIDADPDRDGRGNLLEYVQGTHPKWAQSIAAGEVIFVEEDAKTYPALKVPVSPKARGVKLVVESTVDLVDWTDAANTTVEFDDGDSVTRVFRRVSPVAVGSRHFFRVVALLAPDND